VLKKDRDMDIRKATVAKDATLRSRHPLWRDGGPTAMINRRLLAHAMPSTYETIESTRSGVA
jgi:hypothetical protein